jgi:2C-methyl-D-erythritol 2,4-cyclodiphosphate synthase|tara:strand:- start:304 stop:447 length:144 start_codon:yes stop_codon:yes gene_type:complete
MCINGETFEYFRTQEKVKLIKKCVNTLRSHGYTIIDLEGVIIENDIK